MKFRAAVVLDLEASSIAEAGAKLSELVEHAKRNGEMDVQDVQLGTAPKSEPVTLPTPMPRPERGSTPPPPAPPQPPYASHAAARSSPRAATATFHMPLLAVTHAAPSPQAAHEATGPEN